MSEPHEQALSAIFHALADPTRRAMLRRLAAGEQTVSALAEPYAMSLAAASKHIVVLERAGLVRRTVTGRTHHCRLAAEGLREAQSWLRYYERFWNERLDALAELLAEEPGEAERGS
ncbi:MAG TPA: metalloregulator ArsR/SmtB family transcription factor [Thermoanaerobaculia bacterium]